MSGLYLHIPFCKQACSYCDFYFVTRQQYKQEFVDQLIQEILSKKNTKYAAETVNTIYFGGGTPSLLSVSQVDSILDAIADTFKLDLQEVTLEMNPDDVKREYLSGLKAVGITRASMGVQTFDAELLKFMNRAHTSEEALQCLNLLEASDFEVFTVDLIYGNPGQSSESLLRDIETLLDFNPPHISAYSLTIEPKTRLGVQVKLGRVLPPEDDLVAEHFDLVEEKLGEADILQYEVSNFAREGSEAVHNSNYWNHHNYLGLGPGAHSFWWDEDKNTAKRWSNEKNLKSYLTGGWQGSFDTETLPLPDLAEERIMLALRTKTGISEKELADIYKFRFSNKQREYLLQKEKEGKLVNDGSIHLTPKGLKIADTLLLDLLTAG